MTDLHTTATKHPHARLGTFERRRAEKEKRDAMTAQLRREIALEKERRSRENREARKFNLVRFFRKDA